MGWHVGLRVGCTAYMIRMRPAVWCSCAVQLTKVPAAAVAPSLVLARPVPGGAPIPAALRLTRHPNRLTGYSYPSFHLTHLTPLPARLADHGEQLLLDGVLVTHFAPPAPTAKRLSCQRGTQGALDTPVLHDELPLPQVVETSCPLTR